jgi:hypothetical protein
MSRQNGESAKRNTVDVDFYTEKFSAIERIVKKILSCPHLFSFEMRFSPSLNGYHLEFWCLKKCDLCRLVFDDQTRFSADITNRPTSEQNVLFFQKQKIRFPTLQPTKRQNI